MNTNDNHQPPEDRSGQENGNIIRFPRKSRESRQNEPLINLPPVTKALVLTILAVHAATRLFFDPPSLYWIYAHFGFVPGSFTGREAFDAATVISPLSYMFLHGGWAHVIINATMIMAFGTGVERWIGGRKMLLFFILCGIVSAFIHFTLNPFSTDPVIGASGGISGLFAATLILMQKNAPAATGRRNLISFIVLWIVISVLFGLFGGPGGESIAWAAHIGGFLAGLALIKPILKINL